LCAALCAALLTAGANAQDPVRSHPHSAVLLLADGMGWGHLQMRLEAARRKEQPSALASLLARGRVGACALRPADALVPESAGAASILSTGESMPNRALSQDAEGRRPAGLLERARAAGLATGLVSMGRLTHAVPAAFLTHAAKRDPEPPLAEAVADSGVQVLLGGGSEAFSGALLERVRGKGTRVLQESSELSAVRPGERVLGLFTPDYFPYSIDKAQGAPSLAEMTSSALTSLSSNATGFLLVVDARLIDESSHNNDASAMLAEMAEFDLALARLMDFAQKRKDMLLVLVSPHDTGSPAFVSAANPLDWTGPEHLDRVLAQKGSFRSMLSALWEQESQGRVVDAETVRKALRERFAAGVELKAEDYGRIAAAFKQGPKREAFEHAPACAALSRALEPFYRVRWLTGTHSDLPVPLLSWGPGAEAFEGWFSAEEVSRSLARALRI
jgi:alkaline phosphatase